MALATLIKQPAESRVFSMEFAGLLGSGETLAGVTSVSYTGDDAALTLVGSALYSGTVAQQRLAAGTGGQRYKVTFLVTTSLGNTLEGEGFLQVKDL